jgi:predicted nucleotidyltransferase
VARENAVQLLSERLGIQWRAVADAASASAARMSTLESHLGEFTTEDTSIVVFGSLARDELTSGSDLDWVLLVDGIADPEHLGASLDIEARLNEQEVKGPGAEATFGGLAFSHDLINYIGGGDDTNANLTRRMLLMLESASIGRNDAYKRVINNILGRYIREDYGWMHTWNPRNVPRFLQNDMARYWRTLAVDFAYKRRQRAGRGWALRTAKLRLSRKLTYASGLLMCFDCAINPPVLINSPKADQESAVFAIVDHLSKLVAMTPLTLFANLFLRYQKLEPAARKLFGAYDDFLRLLDDDDQRNRLDNLGQSEIATDPVYQRVREIGHEFQVALDAVFLDQEGCPELYELTKTYGVF